MSHLSHADLCVPLDGGGLRLAEGLEVGHVVVHVLDGEAQDLDAHPPHVGGGHLPHQRGKLVPVLVHLHTRGY